MHCALDSGADVNPVRNPDPRSQHPGEAPAAGPGFESRTAHWREPDRRADGLARVQGSGVRYEITAHAVEEYHHRLRDGESISSAIETC